MNPLAARIHAALPQTQCTRCGYPDCAGYAQAIAAGAAGVNQCPPGGAAGIERLAAIAARPVIPLNPGNGVEGARTAAVIDEDWCIGCTLCLDACPTDAIVGTHKRMHTVIERYCTGCELCVPVCPVDCIALENVTGERTGWQAWSQAQADEALDRYESRKRRLQRAAAEQVPRPQDKAAARRPDLPDLTQDVQEDEVARKKAVIEAALARARGKRGA